MKNQLVIYCADPGLYKYIREMNANDTNSMVA